MKSTKKLIAVAGAGFTGAVIANELAKANYQVEVFDSRSHTAGNCYTCRDQNTGIMEHIYGPHIFHTSDINIWKYVNNFDAFIPYINRVKAIHGNKVYSLPINLLTINSFFNKCFNPDEARNFIASIADQSIDNPLTFEEQALKYVGHDLYHAFFKEYTVKQWGLNPSRLPATILKRLPLRFDYNDNYYNDTYQGIPKNGYTFIINKILDHKNIKIHLNTTFTKQDKSDYLHTFFTGSLDQWFGCSEGRLSYRTLDFAREIHSGNYQGTAVINYCDEQIPWTRITEHKYFTPAEQFKKTIIYKEFSRACTEDDIPYYPIRLAKDKADFSRYSSLAQQETGVTFTGRLGTYRYLDMHNAIADALSCANTFITKYKTNSAMPVFTHKSSP